MLGSKWKEEKAARIKLDCKLLLFIVVVAVAAVYLVVVAVAVVVVVVGQQLRQ